MQIRPFDGTLLVWQPSQMFAGLALGLNGLSYTTNIGVILDFMQWETEDG